MPKSDVYPTYFTVLRGMQFVVAIPFLTLVSFCKQHPSWWTSLDSPAILCLFSGVICCISTTFLLFVHLTGITLDKLWKALPLDILCLLFWIAGFGQFFRPKGDDTDEAKYIKEAHNDKDWGYLIMEPPKTSWYASAGLALIECILFIATVGLMWRFASRH